MKPLEKAVPATSTPSGNEHQGSAKSPELIWLLKTAQQFDVHRWSTYPEVNSAVNALMEELREFRKSKKVRIKKPARVWKHLKVIMIDLWVAHSLGLNPYRGIAKNKNDYQKKGRYHQIYLTYDYLIPTINDLVEMGYIEQHIGFEIMGYRTRIKATDKLIEAIINPIYKTQALIAIVGAVNITRRNPRQTQELILLRDKEKNEVEYKDTAETNLMRENLGRINTAIANSKVTLWLTDEQFEEMENQLRREEDPEKRSINFTNNHLYRVFNNSSFNQGGRFYGGWWQSIPRDYRKFIEINRKPTVEIDYSSHHLRILYAMEKIKPPNDCYDLEGYDRDAQKEAIFSIINAPSLNSAYSAVEGAGIVNGRQLVDALAERHLPIAKHFFSGTGLHLMHYDSQLAESIMLEMLKRGAVALPVHDSFIVRNSYAKELEEVMSEQFEKMFNLSGKVGYKASALEESLDSNSTPQEPQFASDDIEKLLDELKSKYSRYAYLWGL